jgi:hypothetical protein
VINSTGSLIAANLDVKILELNTAVHALQLRMYGITINTSEEEHATIETDLNILMGLVSNLAVIMSNFTLNHKSVLNHV